MKKNLKNIHIIVVEDEPFIARDISDFLEELGYTVDEVCYDAVSAQKSIEMHQPHLCILDINLGKGEDGITLAHKIKKIGPIPFIFLTSYTDDQTLQRAKSSLPHGYISKPIQFDSLKSTVEIALHNFEHRKVAKKLTIDLINQSTLSELTPREFELLQDIYEGKTNKQLSQQHFISLSTVKTHVQRIYEKFDCHSRSELIASIRSILIS